MVQHQEEKKSARGKKSSTRKLPSSNRRFHAVRTRSSTSGFDEHVWESRGLDRPRGERKNSNNNTGHSDGSLKVIEEEREGRVEEHPPEVVEEEEPATALFDTARLAQKVIDT